MATHRYRLIGDIKNDLTFVTEYGDICCFVGEWEETRTEYYQLSVYDAKARTPHLDIWSALAEGEMYINDWKRRPTVKKFIKDAITWLCSEYADDEWVQDDTLFAHIFDEDKDKEARDILTKMGYFVENLWHIDDVKMRYNCTDEQAMEVLRKVLQGEFIMQSVHEIIHVVADEMKLEPNDD